MTLIKKSDVKNYMATRRHKGSPLHLVPTRQPVPTEFPETGQIPDESKPSGFGRDFVGDHTTSGDTVAPSDVSIGSNKPQDPAALGTAHE